MEKRKHKLIFLDRDGTINEEVNYLYRPEDLRIIPGVPNALKRLKEMGFLLVLITNQAGIARGYYTEKDCEVLNSCLNRELGETEAELDAAYYCPHHPEKGIGALKKHCHCRKPETGLFLQAIQDLEDGKFGGETEAAFWQSPLRLSEGAFEALRASSPENFPIDVSHSYMLGDKRIDTRAGHAMGLTSILLGSGYGREEQALAEPGDYDAYFDTMEEAVTWIEQREREHN